MRTTKHSIASVTIALLSMNFGCQVSQTGMDSRPSSIASANYHASYCEIFIDRVAVMYGPYNSKRDIRLYIGTQNEALDAPIARIGYYGIPRDVNDHCDSGHPPSAACSSIDQWRDIEASAYQEEDNYFEMDLAMGYAAKLLTEEGSFYVETTSGTRYWANTAEWGNFLFDPALVQDIGTLGGNINDPQPTGRLSISTQYALHDLNPDQCGLGLN